MPWWVWTLIALAVVSALYYIPPRLRPSACPYALRIFVQLPHPGITRRRLRSILAPAPGERLLEVGPGTGYYALDVAEAIAPRGALEVFDLQQEMLDHTMRKAAKRGISNIEPKRGDARSLPYEDASFDGAFLVTVLGEIPEPAAALLELRRVLKPGGRLVVGETMVDPHYVGPAKLRAEAAAAGLGFERKSGSPLAYFARFTRPA